MAITLDDGFLMSIRNDFAFKLVFSDENNTDILANFLSSVLNLSVDEYEIITISNSEFLKTYKDDKKGILDVKVKVASGKRINIEIQLLGSEAMPDRIMYYESKMYVEQLKAGKEYDSIKKTISINILNFDMLPNCKYHNKFMMLETQEHFPLFDKMEVHTLELKKFRRNRKNILQGDSLEDWLAFISTDSREDLEMLATKNPVMRKTLDYLAVASQDEQMREYYLSREMAIHDEITRRNEATRKGLKEGLEKGLEKGLIKGRLKGHEEVAKKMILGNMPLDIIAQYTDVSMPQLEKMQSLLNEGGGVAE